jgi:hypothetical protein
MVMRIALDVALLVLPLLMFLGFRQWQIARGEAAPAWPWARLIAAGAALVVASAFVHVWTLPDHANEVFVPAHMEDGKFVQGRYEPIAPKDTKSK